MKLVKLSLAAIVAAGALSSVASAASLEEAIKNVDVSGYARYRYDSKNTTTNTTSTTKNYHRFTTDANFKAALDDNFFGVIGFRYDSRDASGERRDANTKVGSQDVGNEEYGQTFNVRQYYLGYTAGNTTIQAGRQVLGTFFTDDMVGTGIKVLNSDISGLTLAAIAFDNLQSTDGDMGTRYYVDDQGRSQGIVIGNNNNEYVYDRNLYGVAAIGSYDPVSFQAWYAALDSVAQLYALDVTLGANLGGADLSLQAQYAGSSVWASKVGYWEDGVLSRNVDLDDAQFLAVKAGAKAFGFDGSVGYVNINTQGDGASLISLEDQGGFITAGEDLLDYTLIGADQSIYFVTAGYTFADKVRVGADYVGARYDNEGDYTDAYEAVARVDYKYSKKLNFKTWYSYIDRDNNEDDAKHLRFEARYNF
ncbi:major outer membrane protein [Campylobacter lanienae NCTC 13004]|uniref:Major outer membrane protein n=1 Tax=Campylobacter lanienae NCTC 13004 TaxID=1031753 RepID=A0A1X9SNZ2_9BACT|nr:porin [Campylobacter lanienae]ARQ98003.1 major outer membrane protein [Campylobacter lanienae NCTC 13004]